ncbi:DNA methyltransferase [Pantoea sp. SM3]|uniref:DNA methyltransferase n=1 Tax=Pantoea sp. SM3 TaxID=1628192 RepID=UPI00350F5E68
MWWATSYSPSLTPQSPRSWATCTKAHTCWPKGALRPLIETFTQPGAIVLDPFAGSGSTCVAAQACGRRWIGIELMEQYHAAGLRRLYAHRDTRAA